MYDVSRLFLIVERSSIFGLYGDVTTDDEGLLNLGLCSAPNAFDQGDIYMYYLYRVTPAVFICDTSEYPKSRCLPMLCGNSPT